MDPHAREVIKGLEEENKQLAEQNMRYAKRVNLLNVRCEQYLEKLKLFADPCQKCGGGGILEVPEDPRTCGTCNGWGWIQKVRAE
jgi:DnaJ-class molecular chaperone